MHVSRRINYARYSSSTLRGSRIRNFSSNLAEVGRVGASGRPSIINVVTRGRKKKRERNRHRCGGIPLFFLSLLSREASPRPDSFRAGSSFASFATSEKPPKGSLGPTKRDVIHCSRVHFAFNPTALRCRDIKFEV